jgi:hypothetical protein
VKEKWGKKRIDEKQIVYIVLILAGLAFAIYVVAQTFDTPTVDRESTLRVQING